MTSGPDSDDIFICKEPGLYGKEYVMGIIEEAGAIDFKNYPRKAEYLLNIREKINRAIATYHANATICEGKKRE